MIQEGNFQLFELELTMTQLKAISSLLPKGFSFEPVPKHGGPINSGPSKKIFTNEKKPVTKKPAKSINSKSDDNNSIIKPAIREPHKRKVLAPMQYIPSDLQVKPQIQPQTPPQPIKSNNQISRKCSNLLQKLKKHPAVGPFLFPVDVKGLGLYDYYDVVREPMDISTVEQKLKKGAYVTASQFAADVRKIWNNAIAYNMEGSEIYLMTLEMKSYFERLYKEIDNVQDDAVRDLEKQVEFLTRQLHEIHSTGIVVNVPAVVPVTSTSTSKAHRAPPSNPKSKSKPSNKNAKLSEKPLTVQERTVLVQNIKKLSPEHLRGVWDLVSQRLDPEGTNTEELEFDVEYLPVDVARELEKYVKHKLSLMNRSKNRAKAREAKRVGEVQTGMNYSQQEEITPKEDDITTQHHSVIDSDGGREENVKGDDLLSDSDGSSFISDSDSEEDNVKGLNYNRANREAVKGSLMGF